MTDNSEIKKLINKELDAMCEKHNQQKFNSLHEAYAVTKEEVEEADSDMQCVKIRLLNEWENVKRDDYTSQMFVKIKEKSIECIQELIQVSACCSKALRGVETK